MKTLLLFRIFFAAAGWSAPAVLFSQPPGRETARPAAAAALDRVLAAAVEHKDVPGVVVIAADKNGVIYQGAFGLAEVAAGKAMKTDAIFHVASMTKAVTSVALMQFVEEGRVSLEDPVSKYFPEFTHPVVAESFDAATKEYKVRPAKTVITVRHLLTHTSGLRNPPTGAAALASKPPEGGPNALWPLLFEPGTDWSYGTGLDWVGRLIEKLSGKTLEGYFQEKIFRPLKMMDTGYNLPAEKQARIVNLLRHEADGTYAEPPRQPLPLTTRFSGSGGLCSTTGDYIRFLRMLLNGGTLDGAQILAPATVAVMEKNHVGEVGVHWGKLPAPVAPPAIRIIADGRDKWGIGFLITTDAVAGKRSSGSLSWAGVDNTYYWFDPARGVAGIAMMQFLPFLDAKALGVYDTFERGVYRLLEK